MNTKVSAKVSDLVLVIVAIGGAIALLVAGTAPAGWTSDRALLPLVADGSRILILLAVVSIVVGIAAAQFLGRGRDTVIGGEAIRYHRYQRLVHWAIAIGFVLDAATAAWLLRWSVLDTSIDIRPALYVTHFVGAGLVVIGSVTFVTSTRLRGEQSLFPQWRDVGPAFARLFGYLGIYGEPGVLGVRWPRSWQQGTQAFLASFAIRPAIREGKFLSVEKVFSFTPLAILAAIVVVTGLIKAGRYYFAVPTDVIYWTTWVHDISVWLTLGVVGAHLAAIFLVPRNWPGIRAMVTGRLPLESVEHEFPAWADELRGQGAGARVSGARSQGTAGD